MAPNPLCLAWREQIMDNLRLISGRSAFIDIYTSRHPNKSYTIYAVKIHKGKRQEILSATGRDLEDAYETLHTKSAQEVHQFVELNGFGFPRGLKTGYDSDSSSGSEVSTSDASEVLSLPAVYSDSDDGDIVSTRDKKTKSRRKGKKKSTRRSKHDSSSEDSSSEVDTGPRRRHAIPVGRPSYIPAHPITGSQPPPAPPGWRGPPARVYPRPAGGPPPPLPPPGRFQPGMRPPHSMAPPAGASLQGTVSVPPPPAPPTKPVRLVIKWAGHGEKKIVEHCQPSHRALQRTALAHVRANWQSFENVIPQEMTPGRLWGLGAKVRRVAFGKDMYAISAAAGDDLGMYFKADDIPKFEIEVDHDGNVAPPPPPPPPAHPHSQQ